MQAENMGGVTHLMYHPNGNYLYSGGRMDSEIICWDLRVPGQIFASYERDAATNQRFYFDLDPSGKYLISGGSKGEIKVWDTTKSKNDNGFVDSIMTFRAHDAAVSGISLNPYLAILATGSGQRIFSSPWKKAVDENEAESSDTGDESIAFSEKDRIDNSLKLWFVGS